MVGTSVLKELNVCNFLLSFLLASFWSPYFHVLSVFPCFKGNWEETTYSAGFLKIWGHGITLIRIFFYRCIDCLHKKTCADATTSETPKKTT